MLKWYKNLYVGNNAKKKKKKIIDKINNGSGQLGIYVITLAASQKNNLDIFSSNHLLQKSFRECCPLIVGIAKGYEEAMDLVQEITQDVIESTGSVDIRGYLENNTK